MFVRLKRGGSPGAPASTVLPQARGEREPLEVGRGERVGRSHAAFRRQGVELAVERGVTPPDPLPAADLEGLPLPASLW